MKQKVQWFLDLYHDGQLDLDPSYQRRSVWTLRDRKYFLDTIFRNYPCPAIFIHRELDGELGKMKYHIVDGKQRLETIILFAQNNIAVDKDYGDLRLSGKKWKSIENDPELKRHFCNYLLPIEFIETDNSIIINEVFDRLNRTSRKLERQELRHAKYDGWLIKTSEAEAEEDEWERLGVVTKARMRRMKDVQCISELLIVFLKNRILGYDQDMLDDFYAEYDSPHETLPDFDENNFKRNLEFTKDYILRMEAHNCTVTKYAKGLSNFYSLWAFVVLNQARLELPEVAAERYSEFMARVATLSKEKDVNKFLRKDENDAYSISYNYLKNSVRAGTDQRQREARNKILEKVLLEHASQEELLTDKNHGSTSYLQSVHSLIRNDGGKHILELAMGKSNNLSEKELQGDEETN